MKQKKKDEEIKILTKEEFRKKRLSLNMSQTDLAKALGYKSYLSLVAKENGTRGISQSDIIILNSLKPLNKTLRTFKTKTKNDKRRNA